MAKEQKTNAMRILDKEKIEYTTFVYNSEDGGIDGVSVAEKISQPVEAVYKTLVAKGARGNYVFVIPVHKELQLKFAAKAVGEKKIELIAVKELLPLTGYIRGGCSPIGMKKLYPTVIDAAAKNRRSVIVSGGKIGIQVEVAVDDLRKVTKGSLEAICQ